MLTWKSKYQLVGEQVAGISGTLIDVGARDRILHKYLPNELTYRSADVVPGHDLLWNLEEPIESPNEAHDIVVALDVLEHLEQIHQAYKELLRITRHKLFISLPNMTGLAFRWDFLTTGRLSGKYDLLPEHQGDRHRWLTSYPQACTFIYHHAQVANCTVKQYDILFGYGRAHNLVARLPLPPALRTYTILFEITKNRSTSNGEQS
ncbi:MAG: methionine biosynthesis protein MetW [Ardenticatenaceae bacterium]